MAVSSIDLSLLREGLGMDAAKFRTICNAERKRMGGDKAPSPPTSIPLTQLEASAATGPYHNIQTKNLDTSKML